MDSSDKKLPKMDSCVNVEREVDKVLSKFAAVGDHSSRTLQDLVEHISNIRKELSEGNNDSDVTATQSLVLNQCLKKVKDTCQRLSNDHKDLHSSVSKVGKAIDRNFIQDISACSVEGAFVGEEKRSLLNEVICEHFFRQGMLDIGEQLIQDARLQIDEAQKEPFFELNRILEALKEHNLFPALEWAKRNRERLQQQSSALEFKLHRLHFIELLKGGPARQMEALLYSRNFEPFAYHHAKEIQTLMGSLLYVQQGVHNSPYLHLLDPIHWLDICDVFTRDACQLLGLSVESPLSVAFAAGCISLPSLLNINHVMKQRQCTNVWNQKDELPIEIDLGGETRYHSIFACPILRQQTTETNPPVRLVCGHVISRDALNKLNTNNKVKCPYCPMEQNAVDARPVQF
ncbi:LOW QUALITY PROTEIN: E3 ubiquitin-protein ligase RMND5A-like [Branchiostoma floridae x Branchiostoma japonicum]